MRSRSRQRTSIELVNNDGASWQKHLHMQESYTSRKRSKHNNKNSTIAYSMEIMPTVTEVLVMSGRKRPGLTLNQLEDIGLASTTLDNDLSYGSTTFRNIGSMKYSSEMRNLQQEQKYEELEDEDALKHSKTEDTTVFEITDLDADDDISFTNENEDALYDFDDDDMMSISYEIAQELDSIASDISSLVPDLNAQSIDASILPIPDPEIQLSERQFLLCMKLAENAAKSDASLFTSVGILHLVKHLG